MFNVTVARHLETRKCGTMSQIGMIFLVVIIVGWNLVARTIAKIVGIMMMTITL